MVESSNIFLNSQVGGNNPPLSFGFISPHLFHFLFLFFIVSFMNFFLQKANKTFKEVFPTNEGKCY